MTDEIADSSEENNYKKPEENSVKKDLEDRDEDSENSDADSEAYEEEYYNDHYDDDGDIHDPANWEEENTSILLRAGMTWTAKMCLFLTMIMRRHGVVDMFRLRATRAMKADQKLPLIISA